MINYVSVCAKNIILSIIICANYKFNHSYLHASSIQCAHQLAIKLAYFLHSSDVAFGVRAALHYVEWLIRFVWVISDE